MTKRQSTRCRGSRKQLRTGSQARFQDAPKTTEDAPKATDRSGWRKGAVWAAGAVITAVLGAAATIKADDVDAWLSGQDPVEVQFTPVPERPAPERGFTLVLPRAQTVPAVLTSEDNCLEGSGLAEGGFLVGERRQGLMVHGMAKDGVAITGARARITGRGPAEGQTAVRCPVRGRPAGPSPLGCRSTCAARSTSFRRSTVHPWGWATRSAVSSPEWTPHATGRLLRNRSSSRTA